MTGNSHGKQWARAGRILILRTILSVSFLFSGTIAQGQQKVDPHFTYYRVYCVVPLVGTGVAGDPIRPTFVPVPSLPEPGTAEAGISTATRNSGIIAFYHEVSDDGKWALAEIVARNRSALQPILTDTTPGVWAAEKGTISRAQLQAVFGKFKKNIDLNRFGVAAR